MCSVICPCDAAAAAPWKALDEATLNAWNRTATTPATNAQTAKNITSLVLTGNETNYLTCLSSLNGGSEIATSAKIILFFEGKYSCSGICFPGLFYFSLDLSVGVPEKPCL
jgi:hypothetical protein